MSTAEYQLEDINKILSPVFEKHGFEYYTPQKQFIKATKTGYVTVILFPQISGTKYLVDIHLGSRIEEVEKLVYSYLRELPGLHNYSITASVPYKKLTQEKHPRIFASTELELMKELEKFHLFMEEKGFGILSNLETLEFLDEAFNTTPSKPIIFQYNQIMRAFRGVALAKLLNKPIENLAAEYRKKIIDVFGTDDQKKKYQDFVSSII